MKTVALMVAISAIGGFGQMSTIPRSCANCWFIPKNKVSGHWTDTDSKTDFPKIDANNDSYIDKNEHLNFNFHDKDMIHVKLAQIPQKYLDLLWKDDGERQLNISDYPLASQVAELFSRQDVFDRSFTFREFYRMKEVDTSFAMLKAGNLSGIPHDYGEQVYKLFNEIAVNGKSIFNMDDYLRYLWKGNDSLLNLPEYNLAIATESFYRTNDKDRNGLLTYEEFTNHEKHGPDHLNRHNAHIMPAHIHEDPQITEIYRKYYNSHSGDIFWFNSKGERELKRKKEEEPMHDKRWQSRMNAFHSVTTKPPRGSSKKPKFGLHD